MIRRRDLTVLLPLLPCCSRPRGQVEIRMAAPSSSIAHAAVYIAKSLGYFQQEGLDVRVEELSSTSKIMEALIGGSVDIGAAAYEHNIPLGTLGREIKSFFVLTTRSSLVLAVTPGNRQIKTAKDLKGRIVGISSFGTPAQNVLKLLLIKNQMTSADVTVVAIGNSSSAIAALENGKADAAILLSAPFEMLRSRYPEVTVLLDLRTAEGAASLFGVADTPSAAVSASSRWLTDNPGLARKIAQALARASRWIHERPVREVEAKLPDSLRTPGSDVAERTLRATLPALSIDGSMPLGGPAAVLDYLKLAVDPSLSVDMSKTYTDEYLEAAP